MSFWKCNWWNKKCNLVLGSMTAMVIFYETDIIVRIIFAILSVVNLIVGWKGTKDVEGKTK